MGVVLPVTRSRECQVCTANNLDNHQPILKEETEPFLGPCMLSKYFACKDTTSFEVTFLVKRLIGEILVQLCVN